MSDQNMFPPNTVLSCLLPHAKLGTQLFGSEIEILIFVQVWALSL